MNCTNGDSYFTAGLVVWGFDSVCVSWPANGFDSDRAATIVAASAPGYASAIDWSITGESNYSISVPASAPTYTSILFAVWPYGAFPGVTVSIAGGYGSFPLSFSLNPPPSISLPEVRFPATDADWGTNFHASIDGGTPPFLVNWSFGDGSTASGVYASHSYSRPGTYVVSAALTDGDGVGARANTTIPVDPALNVTFTHSRFEIGLGQSITVQNEVTGGDPPYAYSWSGLPPGCTDADSAAITCVPTQEGTFNVSVTVTDSAFDSVVRSSPWSTHAAALVVGPPSSAQPSADTDFAYLVAGAAGVALVAVILVIIRRVRQRR